MKNKATKQNQMTIRLQHLPILSISLLISHIDLLHRLGLLIALNINTHTHTSNCAGYVDLFSCLQLHSLSQFRVFTIQKFYNIVCVSAKHTPAFSHNMCFVAVGELNSNRQIDCGQSQTILSLIPTLNYLIVICIF